MTPQIYTASKVRHAPKWRLLREVGFNIVASWLDFPEGPLTQPQQVDLWRKCVDEAAAAHFVLLYAEEGDVLKGALVEAGSCLANGGVVLQVGTSGSLQAGDGSDASFRNHPNWHRCESIGEALKQAGQW